MSNLRLPVTNKQLSFRWCKQTMQNSFWKTLACFALLNAALFSKVKHWRVIYFIIIIFFFFKTIFILQNDYHEAESCELQLESSHYSRIQDLMLDWINYISNYAFIKKSNKYQCSKHFLFFWLPRSMHKFYSHRPPSWLCQKTASLRVTVTV